MDWTCVGNRVFITESYYKMLNMTLYSTKTVFSILCISEIQITGACENKIIVFCIQVWMTSQNAHALISSGYGHINDYSIKKFKHVENIDVETMLKILTLKQC